MKNLTEGEKMVWAAVYAMEIGNNSGMRLAVLRVSMHIRELRRLEALGLGSPELETAKEVLK